jgi:hypothetical protein
MRMPRPRPCSGIVGPASEVCAVGGFSRRSGDDSLRVGCGDCCGDAPCWRSTSTSGSTAMTAGVCGAGRRLPLLHRTYGHDSHRAVSRHRGCRCRHLLLCCSALANCSCPPVQLAVSRLCNQIRAAHSHAAQCTGTGGIRCCCGFCDSAVRRLSLVLIPSEMHSETRASECCFGLLSAPPATPSRKG